ncbi:MAG: hypothetical protein KKC72_17795 [Alphaproteobacteria bacterium]|nr:hypothetical protein [Alphaproteobacteria bacterium]
MKKAVSFRLSPAAKEALVNLAARYDMSQTAVIEKLILDRASVSDREKNTERRYQARRRTLKRSPHLSSAGFFQAGYRAGWLDFQTRHGEDTMIEPI